MSSTLPRIASVKLLLLSQLLSFLSFSQFRLLEGDKINKIAFWLCHVLWEERHQGIEQLQQEKEENFLRSVMNFCSKF